MVMPTDTFASFGHRIDVFANGISDSELKQVMTKLGVAAKADALSAASADLGGDPKFSGWAPTLETRFDHVGEGRISFHPTGKSAGPWTVAQEGRHQAAGPPAPTKKKGKGKGKKWNGRTAGKGTAMKALAKIEAETPDRFEKELKKVLKKAFD